MLPLAGAFGAAAPLPAMATSRSESAVPLRLTLVLLAPVRLAPPMKPFSVGISAGVGSLISGFAGLLERRANLVLSQDETLPSDLLSFSFAMDFEVGADEVPAVTVVLVDGASGVPFPVNAVGIEGAMRLASGSLGLADDSDDGSAAAEVVVVGSVTGLWSWALVVEP